MVCLLKTIKIESVNLSCQTHNMTTKIKEQTNQVQQYRLTGLDVSQLFWPSYKRGDQTTVTL